MRRTVGSKLWYGFVTIILVAVAGCTTPTLAPDPDGPVLQGFNALPKALATIELSPTPDYSQASATPDTSRPTATFAPPTRTSTPTPYVGVFMGARTPIPGTVVVQSTANSPLVVTMAGTAGTGAVSGPAGSTPLPAATGAPAGPGTGPVAVNCAISPAAQFANASANAAVQRQLGCPSAPPTSLQLVTLAFQNGVMFWRNTQEIYILSTAAIQKGGVVDTFWRVADTWNESMPASDPSLSPPDGFTQPVRGFGYVWRNNPQIRDQLGWAIGSEQVIESTWQNFAGGWMMTGANGVVYALSPTDGAAATTGVHFGALPQ